MVSVIIQDFLHHFVLAKLATSSIRVKLNSITIWFNPFMPAATKKYLDLFGDVFITRVFIGKKVEGKV